MSDFHLVWRGKTSASFLLQVEQLLMGEYPSAIRRIETISRSLERFVSDLLAAHDGVLALDNELYWIKPLRELKLSLTLRSGNDGIFPDALLSDEGLSSASPTLIKLLYTLVCEEIEYNLNIRTQTKIVELYNIKSLSIYADEQVELLDNFEKNQLGVFLYLMYLRRRFAKSPSVCVLTSELTPLFKKAKEVEHDLLVLTQSQFETKQPRLVSKYLEFKKMYAGAKIHIFRLNLLVYLINELGPYIIGTEKPDGTFKIEPTRSFMTLFDRCKNAGSRYSVSFVTVFTRNTDEDKDENRDPEDERTASPGHATLLLIDHREKVIERFDPNGVGVNTELQNITRETDNALGAFADEQKYKYAEPATFCPRLGIQSIEHLFSDKAGYCVSWSVLYAEERLLLDKTRNYVAEYLLDIIIDKYKLRGANMKETAENVKRWMEERIQTIFSDMGEVYKELSDYLEIRVSYVKGKLVYFV